MLISHALSQHSVNRANNFLSRARPAPSSTNARPALQMRVKPLPMNL